MMHIYMAAVFSNSYMKGQNRYLKLTDHERDLVTSIPHVLESFHYVGKQKFVDEMRVNNAQIFLDSGAFSAFTLGVNISVEDYCEYIKRNLDIIRVEDNVVMASVLDGIGDPLQTWRNQLEMELRGAKPLPCFHAGEDERYLEWYVKNYEYITLGGMVGSSTKQLCIWLDRMWDRYLTDGSGRARIKVHGFGITAVPIMERYPWHCMTEENHQVLTKFGWKSLNELKIGMEILCGDDKDNQFWSQIEELPIFEVKNAEISILENRNIKAYVSHNHKWLTRSRGKSKWKFRTTEELVGTSSQDWLIPRTGQYSFPEATYTNEFVELAGWFWTDGTINRRKRYKKDSVSIYQSKTANPEKCERIRKSLIDAGEKFCESFSQSDGVINFELYGNIAEKLLLTFPEKHLTWDFIYSLSKSQMELFIEISILGDGTKGSLKKGKSFQIVQKSDRSIDQFQVACLLAGIPCNKSQVQNSLVASNVMTIDPSQVKRTAVNYSGRLWCVRVKSGAFYTKCEGKIYLTGNSCDSSSWIQSAAFGSIVTPHYGPLSVSEKSPSRHDAGQHVTTLTPIEQDHILQYLENQGFTYERLSTVYESRAAYNLWAFGVINTMINAQHNEKYNERIQELF